MIQIGFPVSLLFLFTVIFTLNATSLPQMKGKRLDHPETTFKTMKQRLLHDSQFEQNQDDPAGNPYIYLACNSSSQCQDTMLKECEEPPKQAPNTWYCDCYCDGFPRCQTNKDCCNNNCVNGICKKNTGTQGTSCGAECAGCAPGYECQSWGLGGFCNSTQGNTTHLSTTSGNLTTMSTLITTSENSRTMSTLTTSIIAVIFLIKTIVL